MKLHINPRPNTTLNAYCNRHSLSMTVAEVDRTSATARVHITALSAVNGYTAAKRHWPGRAKAGKPRTKAEKDGPLSARCASGRGPGGSLHPALAPRYRSAAQSMKTRRRGDSWRAPE